MGGCWVLLTSLGEWSLSKTRWWGVRWNVGADSTGVSEVTAACGGGLQVVLGDHLGFVLGGEGATTLGESREVTLGLAGAGWWFDRRDEGASTCHDSKTS
jgi:hypothetical protein